MLALSELTDKADCVLPIENQSLLDICRTIHVLKATDIAKGSGAARTGSGVSDRGGRTGAIRADEKPFDSMNNIIANLLLNLTRLVLLYS